MNQLRSDGLARRYNQAGDNIFFSMEGGHYRLHMLMVGARIWFFIIVSSALGVH